ncbi:MAG: CopG family transcriptional regulator [Acidobacteria bacterium]|nr:CopG family transcriptional regulator [Acidobacteriota bacterium]
MTSERYDVVMSTPKRSTIYFDPELHRAVRLKAAALDASISDVVNEAVRRSLTEDASDLEAFEKRRKEPVLDFESVVMSLRRSGKL